MPPPQPPDDLSNVRARARELTNVDLRAALTIRGVVMEVRDGVAQVAGLQAVAADELVVFESGARGMAYDISDERTGVVLLTHAERVSAGQGVRTTGELPTLTVGPHLLGRVVDPLGQPLDGGPAPSGPERAVFQPAPGLTERVAVTRPLLTGTMAIDAAIPIGRGQRQLILGDRNVGKTALALDIVAAQKNQNVICVYVVIGQPLSRVLAIAASLRTAGAFEYTVVVAADAAESPAMQYLAPYAGTTVAEAFQTAGHDTVVIYDDLTKHADAYRELALLLERPPGREAFPGDIFYIHGELLERATAFKDEFGGGSVTAFPIVETTDNDISSYIPTNLISITDGQLYLDSARFERNERPAIDIGKSVSRIGGVAQSPVLRATAKNLRIQITRFESLEAITRVGLDLDPKTRATLEHGQILRRLLRQARFNARSVLEQALILRAASTQLFSGLSPAQAAELSQRLVTAAREGAPDLVATLERGEVPEESAWHALPPVMDKLRKASNFAQISSNPAEGAGPAPAPQGETP